MIKNDCFHDVGIFLNLYVILLIQCDDFIMLLHLLYLLLAVVLTYATQTTRKIILPDTSKLLGHEDISLFMIVPFMWYIMSNLIRTGNNGVIATTTVNSFDF